MLKLNVTTAGVHPKSIKKTPCFFTFFGKVYFFSAKSENEFVGKKYTLL